MLVSSFFPHFFELSISNSGDFSECAPINLISIFVMLIGAIMVLANKFVMFCRPEAMFWLKRSRKGFPGRLVALLMLLRLCWK